MRDTPASAVDRREGAPVGHGQRPFSPYPRRATEYGRDRLEIEKAIRCELAVEAA